MDENLDENLSNAKAITQLKPVDILPYFKTTSQGLTRDEILLRQKKYGKNKLPNPSAFNPFKLLFKQFTHFMAILLWIAGFLAIIAEMPELAIATWAVIVINALFSFFQEYKADKALTELANMLPNKVNVYRDGELMTSLAEDLTIGDLLVLETGNSVPADARILESAGLNLDNSLLTGESISVGRNENEFNQNDKTITESTNLVFAGTTVTEGKALAVVYAIGSQTELGKVSKLTQTIQRGESTLEIQVQKIVKFITKVAIVLGLLAFALAVFGVGLDYKVGFIFAIGIIVANIPEGLLPTVSLSLAVGVQRMAKQNALVRRLSAVETLSAVSVICTDKTGTITQNQLMVKKLWTPDLVAEFEGAGYAKEGKVTLKNQRTIEQRPELSTEEDRIRMLLTASTLCSEATIVTNKADPHLWDVLGAPTEAALLIAAEKYGLRIDTEQKHFKRINTLPFNSEKKMMQVLVQNISNPLFANNAKFIFIKGAPVEVLNTCGSIYKNGVLTEIHEGIKQEITQEIDLMANEGYRVLGIAYNIATSEDFSLAKPAIFLGFAAMVDPPRPEVYDAFQQCAKAGIRITIITGDYGITAATIAQQLGLKIDREHITTGKDLDAMPEDLLEAFLKKQEPLIFSRTTPVHKLRIVEAYKRIGEIVAVTGDGVNDTLALKSSHIGIAMGIGGTDVAREAADIVLLDNNFATIVKAIEEGRSIYMNIKKFLTYILTSNFAEVTPFVAMAVAKIPPALTILQILAIDLGTDIVPALALGAEKPEKGILAQPPRKLNENILNRGLFLRAYAFLGVIEGILSLAVFLYVWLRAGYSFADLQHLTNSILYHTAPPDVIKLYRYSTTMAFASINACQVGNLFICRSERLPFWTMFASKNNLIYIGLGFEILISLAIIFLPALAGIFQTQPLTLQDLKIIVLCPVILITLEEIRKAIARKRAF